MDFELRCGTSAPIYGSFRLKSGVPASTGGAVVAISSTHLAPQLPGTPITFVATPQGSAAYEFQWAVFDGAGWTPLCGWNIDPTCTWTPRTSSRRYLVAVWARLEGSTDSADRGFATVGFPIARAPRPSGANLILTGPGAGGWPHVLAANVNGARDSRFNFLAYDMRFSGGVSVALADVDRDGTADVVTGAGPGGAPHVRVFATQAPGQPPREIAGFLAYDPGFAGGVSVALGDVTGDGVPEIVTAAGPGGGPHVRVFEIRLAGPNGPVWITERAGFFAYDPAFGGGVRIAIGDLDGNGVGEIITAAGPGGGPHVRAFRITGTSVVEVLSMLAYGAQFTGGVFVAAGDVDGDGQDDIITGADAGASPHVRIFSTQLDYPAQIASFLAYSPAFSGGVRVAAGDLDGDGLAEIITGAGRGGGPHVIAFAKSLQGVSVPSLVLCLRPGVHGRGLRVRHPAAVMTAGARTANGSACRRAGVALE